MVVSVRVTDLRVESFQDISREKRMASYKETRHYIKPSKKGTMTAKHIALELRKSWEEVLEEE